MNKKKKIFLSVWVVVTAALFYFFGPSRQAEESPVEGEVAQTEREVEAEAPTVEVREEEQLNASDELPAKLKDRIDNVLSKIEDMWDPTGDKVKEVGEKMDALEVALEDNKPDLAEKILSEIETIVSEK